MNKFQVTLQLKEKKQRYIYQKLFNLFFILTVVLQGDRKRVLEEYGKNFWLLCEFKVSFNPKKEILRLAKTEILIEICKYLTFGHLRN